MDLPQPLGPVMRFNALGISFTNCVVSAAGLVKEKEICSESSPTGTRRGAKDLELD